MILTNNEFLLLGIILSLGISLLGVFIVLRKMVLVGDVLSHVALPGFALAVLYNINPFWGALLFLLIAVFGIIFLERYYSISLETTVGIFFTAFLAIGLVLIPNTELAESLFGDISELGIFDFYLTIILGLFVLFSVLIFFNKFAKISISRTLAEAEGIGFWRIELIFLMLLALVVALGVKSIGVLLIGALIILPASAAKNVSNSLKAMTFFSIIFGVISMLGGFYLALYFNLPLGPVIILVGVIIFMLSLIAKLVRS